MQFSRNEDTIIIDVMVTLLPLTPALVREGMAEAGFGRCFMVSDQLTNLLADYQALQSDLKQQKIPDGYRIQRKIALRKNAELKLEIAPDAMTASATIIAAWGGTPISANELVKAAQEYGVSFGFQKEQIVHVVSTASRAEPGVVTTQIIAVGRIMQPGLNARFEALVAGMAVRVNKPVMSSNSRSDLRDFGVIPAVQLGQGVVRRLPPTKGVDGINVRSEVTLALPGVQIEWQNGEGVEVSATDPDLLVAARDGMPRILDAGATVDEVYAVKKVDLSTGHIQFRGAVIVNGDVTEGMKVIAGGNVFIKGTVEGELVESGGDISIGGSIIGHQINPGTDEEQFSTMVKAKGDIRCTLAQYVKVECEGDFHAVKQINHCNVSARMAVAGPEDKLTGKVVGGHFYLDLGIKCGVLGSPSESSLTLNINRRIDPVAEKQQALRQNVAAVKVEMEQIKASVEQMKKLEKSDATTEHMNAFIEEFEAQKTVAIALIEDIKRLEAQRVALMLETAVIVKQQMFGGVDVQVGSEKLPVKREYGASQIKIIEGALKIDPLIN
ncbi:MAG: FapA family protein [Gammaproteobacteria bacterium]|nr:FapA family protein [Gammaproteobacteria bacterium]